MKRRVLIGLAIVTVTGMMAVLAYFVILAKSELREWLWHDPDQIIPLVGDVMACDTQIVKQEAVHRKMVLLKWSPDWVESGHVGQNLYWQPKVSEGSCPRGLSARSVHNGSQVAIFKESETYASGKKLLVVNSDVPEGSVDTVCECVEIAFSYCDREVKYTLETGEENYKHWDQVDHKYLSRAEADSVLLSWGIRRELPPEDHPWRYREEQLRKAEESQR